MRNLERHYTLSNIYNEITKRKKVYSIVDILFELDLSFYIRHSGCIDDCRTIGQIIEKLYIEGYGSIIEKIINSSFEPNSLRIILSSMIRSSTTSVTHFR